MTPRRDEPFPPATGRLRRELLWAALFVPLALVFTWPVAWHPSAHLAGDLGDNWQTLWGFEWVRRALLAGHDPFFTRDLWHPTGATLVFQTFDLPELLLYLPLRLFAGPWTAFNLVFVADFALSGAAMYALGRATGCSRAASFLSGAAYTFSTFHFGHALGHLHLVSLEWLPLYVLAFVRVLEGARWRWAFAGGVLLVLVSLASWYGLVAAFIVSTALLLGRIARGGRVPLGPVLARAGAMCATYLVLILPLGVAMLHERAAEKIEGAHPATIFSADLQSFFLPNAASALSPFTSAWRSWTGNPAENASYLGFVLVFLVFSGLVLRAPKVASYLVAAVAGVVFALGPGLHVGGHVVADGRMPYAYLVRAFPLLSFMGVPVRFALATTFGLAAALAPSLDALSQRFRPSVALSLGVLAILEHVPHQLATSELPTPAPMTAWANDPTRFAVLDACRDSRALWHQTVHEHPIFGGYLTRTPARLERELAADPVAGPLLAWDAPSTSAPVTLASLDTNFAEPIAPGAEPKHFSFDVSGTLEVPKDGTYTFTVDSDDGALLFIDGRLVVDDGGDHGPRTKSQALPLTDGAHALRLRYHQAGGGALLRVTWEGPGVPATVLGPSALPHGLTGIARFRRRTCAVSREAAIAHLRALEVRYVVVDDAEPRYLLETELGLSPAFEGDGVRIYEVPP